MCGIVYVKRKDGKPAYKSVLKRYRSQKSRGTEGYGYVAIKNNEVVSYKRSPTEHEIIKLLEKEDAPEILFHHRNPTSTPNVEEEAHPLLVENEALLDHQYFVAHNGVIRNSDELKKAHEVLGFKYNTEMIHNFYIPFTKKVYREDRAPKWNDSESLAIETALALDGFKTSIDARGYASVIGLQTVGPKVTSRFFYKNMNPLKFHEDKVMITITSMGQGTEVDRWKIFKLKDGGGFEQFGKVEPPLSYETETKNPKHYPGRSTPSPFAPKGGENRRDILNDGRSIGFGPYDDEGIDAFEGADFYARSIYEEGHRVPLRLGTKTIAQTEQEYVEKLLKDTEKYVAYPAVYKIPTDILLDNWNKCVDFEKKMKDAFVSLNVIMATGQDNATDDVYLTCEKLESRMKRMEVYRGAVESEIMKREATVR